MSDNTAIIDELRLNNPFKSSASPLPWENVNPDIQQLNRETSDEIEQLMRQKRREPNLPLAGLVLGEAGSGKTHMLTRILRRLRSNARSAIFVAVKAFRDPETAAQHLLSEIFISLKRIHSSGRTQFDMLMSEVMNSYHERRRNDGFNDSENIDLRTYLGRDMPDLDRNFLKCIIMYLGTTDESVKTDILDWLNGGLDDNDSLKLGLPLKDMSSMTEAKRENISEKTLISLGTVLAYAKVPMMICFDQLDAMKRRDLIEAWSRIVGLLMNDLSGILPLCFIKAETWHDVFLPVLDDAVVQRLRNNTMIMKTCSLAQAKQLIHDRIAYTFKSTAEEKYKWLLSRMGETLKPGFSPRMVIELANKAIMNTSTGDKTEEIYNTFRNAYDDECRKVRSEAGAWPPNSEHLTLALEVWLKAHDGIELNNGDGKTLKFTGTYGDRKLAFVVVAAKSHFVASAGFKKGTAFMKEYPEGLCCYITEAKTHKKTWKQANENMRIFEEAGGHVIMLDDESRITWYGLTALINRVDNGDVNLYISACSRAATREDIRTFIRSIKLIPDIFTAKPVKSVPMPAPKHENVPTKPETLGMNLKGIINASPMNILTVEKAVELLAKRRIITNRNEILSFVKDNSGIFRTFQSKNDILITFADKK